MEQEKERPTEPLSEKERKKQEKLKKKEEKRKEKLKRSVRLYPANKKGYHVMRGMNVWRILFYPIHRFFYPFKMYGPKKVGKGACIYVGNHYCIFDIFYPAHTTWEGLHFMTKESIFHVPVLGHFAVKYGAIGAMRDGSDVKTLMDSMRVLKNGEKISLFPEGTRNKVSTEEFLPFHGGAALLAIKTKTPIVPFVICNKPRVFHMTHVVFGEPFEFSEYYDRKLTGADYEEADAKLVKKLYDMREAHREWLRDKKSKKGKK